MRKIKRKTMWIMHPTEYEIFCDLCKGSNITWSEYDHLIWCYDCQKDTRGTEGSVFDGPIPVGVCAVLGLSFDKISLKTGKRLYLKVKDGK